MRFRLYLKFLLCYLFFGAAGFAAVATLSSRLTYDYLTRSRSRTLYDEANLIASTYSTVYQGNNIELAQAYPQLQAVATYLQAQIWVMSRNGDILVDSDGHRDGDIIPNFDPTATGNRSYMVGSYFGSFPYEVLSVSAPITGNFRTYGYVVIHLPMDQVQDSANEILNIVYITFVIVFLLSLSLLLVFFLSVSRPLREITRGAGQFAEGNLSYRIRIRSRDEMGYLANTMNYMAEQLERSEEAPRTREVRRDTYTVQSCMFRIQRRVRAGGCTFDELFDGEPSRSEVVTLFMALLELIKLGRVTVKQRGVFGHIAIDAAEKVSA